MSLHDEVWRSPGETPPATLNAEPTKRELIDAAIIAFVSGKRGTPITPAELGAASSGPRLVLLRNGFLLACIRHCRNRPLADTTLAVLAVIYAMADNPRGLSMLSFARIGRLLKRRSDTIGEVYKKLEQDGLVASEGSLNSPRHIRPIIDRVAADANSFDINDALAPSTTDLI